jgi:hypothetical protein
VSAAGGVVRLPEMGEVYRKEKQCLCRWEECPSLLSLGQQAGREIVGRGFASLLPLTVPLPMRMRSV